MALTIKGGAYESPGSRNYQPSWKKTDHLLLKWQNNFQCSSTDLEWFFLVKNITKSCQTVDRFEPWDDSITKRKIIALVKKNDNCVSKGPVLPVS